MTETPRSSPALAPVGWEAAVVVGLGNPGPDYAGNRHNVGAMVIAEIAAGQGVALKRAPGRLSRAVCASTRLGRARVVLARLTTYMNESGQAVRPLLDYYKAEPTSLIVVHDELDLPFGTVRIKQGGGDNGHNGLRSITQSLRTPGYTRVRVGRRSGADYVLGDFAAAERERLPAVLDLASHAVTLVIEVGLVHAQNHTHITQIGDIE
jgi:PTH1 family peptidyl-tRNA hydrolase